MKPHIWTYAHINGWKIALNSPNKIYLSPSLWTYFLLTAQSKPQIAYIPFQGGAQHHW